MKRRVGPKRAEGSRNGLTRAQAEGELRRLMAEVQATPTVGHSLTVDAAGERYQQHLKLTAIMAGLRHGELIALRWRDVDWPAGRIRVRQNFVLGEFDTPKSRRATRSVPMADRLAGELDRLYKAADEPGDDELVFPDPIYGRAARQGREPAPLPQGAQGRVA